MYDILMKDIPNEDRPIERLEKHGATTLSNTELLAILIGNGMRNTSAISIASKILASFGQVSKLQTLDMCELQQFPGIGKVKTARILAALEFGKRMAQPTPKVVADEIRITQPLDVFHLLHFDLSHLAQEHFIILYLDIKQNLIKKETLFIGTMDQTTAHPREIFVKALNYRAASFICVHNHPSGDVTPSDEDILLTKEIEQLSLMMRIPLIDHIIIAGESYASFRTLGHIN